MILFSLFIIFFLTINFSDYAKFRYVDTFYNKLKTKGVILRSTEYGYKIKDMLRLTIGSRVDCQKFIRAVEGIFNKYCPYALFGVWAPNFPS